MAQTGYTPILIYSSSTAAAAPAAGNLTNSTLGSELAINITDGKLFYKDNANAIQVIGWKTTPTTAGGTGLTSYTAGDLLYYATGTTLTRLGIGAANTVLTSSGTAPQWSSALTVTGLTDSGNLVFTGTGNRITGDFSNATQANRVMFQNSVANSASVVTVIPSGTGNSAVWQAINNSDPTNASAIRIQAGGAECSLQSLITGTGTYLPLAIYTGGSQRIWIDTAGQFGIGGSPGYPFQLTTNTNGSGTANIYNNSTGASAQSVLLINTNGAFGLQIFQNYSSKNAGIYLGDNAALAISTNAIERARVFSSGGVSIGDTTDPGAGNLRLGTGNLIIGTSGKGIDFSATAGTGTSELLADYEEGTWTPTIASNTGTITSYTSSGSYTKVGRQVTLILTFKITNNGTGAGYIKITNLPFNVITGNSAGTGAEVSAVGYQTVAYAPSSAQINMFKYDWTYPGGLNHEFYVTITYQN